MSIVKAEISMSLGDGTRLFESTGADPVSLRVVGVVTTPMVTHLTYDVAA